jgi:hypothetical protein
MLYDFLQIVVVFQNAYTFLALSLERYIAIMYPFKRRLTVRQCTLVIALTWFMSFGTPVPTAIVSELDRKGFCLEAWPGGDAQRFQYSMTIMVLQYFVPLTVLVYTYTRIVIVVWLKDQPPHGQMGGPVYRPPPIQPATPLQPATTMGGYGGGTGGGPNRHLLHRESTAGFDDKTGSYVDPRKRVSTQDHVDNKNNA